MLLLEVLDVSISALGDFLFRTGTQGVFRRLTRHILAACYSLLLQHFLHSRHVKDFFRHRSHTAFDAAERRGKCLPEPHSTGHRRAHEHEERAHLAPVLTYFRVVEELPDILTCLFAYFCTLSGGQFTPKLLLSTCHHLRQDRVVARCASSKFKRVGPDIKGVNYVSSGSGEPLLAELPRQIFPQFILQRLGVDCFLVSYNAAVIDVVSK